MASLYVSTVSSEDYEPYPLDPADVIDGTPNSRVHWLRQEGAGGASLMTGVFVSDPATCRYTWESDETIMVLEGEVKIDLDSGESVELAPGSIASFQKGEKGVWNIKSRFKEFFVLSG